MNKLVDDPSAVTMIVDMSNDQFRNLVQRVRNEGKYVRGLADFLGSASPVCPSDANKYLLSLTGRVRLLAIALLKSAADHHKSIGSEYIIGPITPVAGVGLPSAAFEMVEYAGVPMQRQIANQAYDDFTRHLYDKARALGIDPDTLSVRQNTFLNGVNGAPDLEEYVRRLKDKPSGSF